MLRFSIDNNSPSTQLAFTLIVSFASFLLFMLLSIVIAIPFWGSDVLKVLSSINLSDPSTIQLLKMFQIMQAIGLFIIPPFILAYLFSSDRYEYLGLKHKPGLNNVLIVAGIMIISIPIINYLATLNSLIKFPQFMSGLEQFFMSKEADAKLLTDAFIKTTTVNGLLLNILMIGILPALGEELLFRGVLQRIFTNWTRNIHLGIFISAFLFSAIHMQFYGFVPRLLLGAFFGYLYFWSGSLWLPILAHFVNNTFAVFLYYFISKGIISEKVADLGATTDLIPITMICSMISYLGIWFLFKNNRVT